MRLHSRRVQLVTQQIIFTGYIYRATDNCALPGNTKTNDSNQTRIRCFLHAIAELYTVNAVKHQCFGSESGSALIRLFWIRIHNGNANPDPKARNWTILTKKTSFPAFQNGLSSFVDMFLRHITYTVQESFYVKIKLFATAKSDQDPDSNPDPHWFGSLDPDPQWDKKMDSVPHWNQCGSETQLKTTR